jgi:hypothetical protein
LLKARGDEWTPARELSERISLQYSRVIHCLRKKGFLIENRVEVKDGKRFGFFRLVVLRAVMQPEKFDQARLFSDSLKYFDPEEAIR